MYQCVLGFKYIIIFSFQGRGGLLVPWMVLLLLVMGSIVYDAVQAGLRGDTKSLLISAAALIVASVVLLIVNSYASALRKRQKLVEASATLRLFTNPISGEYDNMHRHTQPFLYTDTRRPDARYLTYGDIALCRDLPPDYDTAAASKNVTLPGKKIIYPSNLGIRR